MKMKSVIRAAIRKNVFPCKKFGVADGAKMSRCFAYHNIIFPFSFRV